MQGVLPAHQVPTLTLMTSTHSVSAARNASFCRARTTGVVTPCLRMYLVRVVPFTTLQRMVRQGEFPACTQGAAALLAHWKGKWYTAAACDDAQCTPGE